MKKYIIAIILMFTCFFISSLFFINSELIDEDTGTINEHGLEILRELDKMPFVNIDVEELEKEVAKSLPK